MLVKLSSCKDWITTLPTCQDLCPFLYTSRITCDRLISLIIRYQQMLSERVLSSFENKDLWSFLMSIHHKMVLTFKQDRYADTGIVVIRHLQKTAQHISISHWILALLSSFVEFSQTLESHIHPWKSISWFTASSIPGASTWHLKMFVAPPDGSIKPSALALDAIFKCSNSRHPCTFLILCDEFLST